MKKIVLVFISAFLFAFVDGQTNKNSFYDLSFKTINGDSVWLKSYIGKRVFFYILPMNQSDSNFAQLQAFKNRYRDSVEIIGIVSLENGYEKTNARSLQAMYNKMGIVLTEGVYTKKTSGENQSPLLRWLTDKNKNTHYDMDVIGIGQKFFVSPVGRLYAVMPPQMSLNHPLIDRIVHTK